MPRLFRPLSALALALALLPLPGCAANDCVEAGRWTRIGAQAAAVEADNAALIDELAARKMVLLGERHDDIDHHRWQLQVISALHARQPRMAIGFEMFPRRLQSVLDRWVAGELAEADFLREVEWERIWNVPASLYLPLFHFARINRVPMIALNVDQKLTRTIAAKGWQAVEESEREGVGQAAPPSEAYLDLLFDIHRHHQHMRAGGGKDGSAGESAGEAAKSLRDSAEFRNFVDSQQTWDRAMAEALAARSASAEGALVVGIIGSGHLRHGYGVPHQLRALGVDDFAVALPVSADQACAELVPGYADAVFALPAAVQAPPPPPRLGVILAAEADGVRLAEVKGDSLAADSGLKAGDVIIEAAGSSRPTVDKLIRLVRSAPPGTWLPLKLRRGEESIEVVVRFPVEEP